MRCVLIIGMALLWLGSLGAEEARNPVRNERFEKLPEKEAAAVAEKWGIPNLAQRLRSDEANNYADVFWEMLTLLDKKPEARADGNVEAVLGWVVLDSERLPLHAFSDPVYIRIPKMLPALGKRVLKLRLAEWVNERPSRFSQNAPWLWPEYSKIDAAALRAAMRETYDGAQKHNPTVQLNLALGLAAVGDPDARKVFEEARASVLKNFETQGHEQIHQALIAAAGQGVKAALPLLAENGRLIASEPNGKLTQDSMVARQTMDGLRRLLNWPPADKAFDAKRRLRYTTDTNFEPIQKWLDVYLEKLTWDAASQRYRGDAPPPGQEKLYAAARAVKVKYEVDWLEPMEGKELPDQIVDWAEELKVAAADMLVADLLSEVLELPQYRNWLWSKPLSSRLGMLPATAEAFTQRVLVTNVRNRLEEMEEDFAGANTMLAGENRDAADKAMQELAPVYLQQVEQALREQKNDAALLALMRVMVCGRTVPRETAIKVFGNAPTAWRVDNGQLYRWWNTLLDLKRANCMLFLLQWGAADLTLPEKPVGRFQPVEHFITYMSWNRDEDVPEVPPAQLLAICEEWYTRNEAGLIFDKKRSGFEFVPSPRRQMLLDALKPMVEKYNVSVEQLLHPPKRGNYLTDNARPTWDDLAALSTASPEVLKEPAYRAAVEAMARLFAVQDNYPRKMMPVLSQVESPLAAELIRSTLKKAVAHSRTVPHIHMISNASRNLQELHPPLVRVIQDEVARELRNGPQPEAAVDRLQMTYLLAALNQAQPAAELQKRFKDAGPAGFDRLNSGEAFQVIARQGNPAVHRLFLVAGREVPARRAQLLRQFESLALGIAKRGFVTPAQDEALLARYETWLDANEEKIVWNRETRRYEGPKPDVGLEDLAPVVPPVPKPQPQGKSVKPPAPPEF